ncbi:TonB-dependent receptor family protein [Jejuia pallidilutea]|uniref:TonB-dependent receptor family protein n=1 Tax=Jejuia pallidilutea TaxID=504487 RepID=UPI000697BEFB|nr:TonB-dependent receptor [Jejuia pallidilutea]
MKKKQWLPFIIAVLVTQVYFCQTTNLNRIIDSENGILVSEVEITQLQNDSTFTSNTGFFKIKTSGLYTFNKEGYILKTLKLNPQNNYVVKLQKQPNALNEIVINASHLPMELKASTSSVSLVSSKAIERANTVNINEALNRVPGVFMQTGALNTNRITIRGVGSRNLFGTSKIRAYFKDIPLTNGSGETSLEDFELGALSRIEITKGATSSTYGAGLGGVIRLLPKTSSFNSTGFENETSIGSFGLFKNLSQINYGNASNSYKLVYSNTKSNGFRENNDYKRHALTLNTVHKLNAKNELSILGTFSDLKAFIPSSLNETDFANNPESAAFTWKQSRGFEDTKRGIIGISLIHKFNEKLEQSTSVFMSFRNSYEPRPFNILDETVFGYGLRHRITGNLTVNDKKINWTSGIEFFKDNYKYQTFENLYEDFPEANSSIKGVALSNFKEKRYYYNLFFEGRYPVTSKTDVVFGINYNKTSYNLDDKFPVSSTNPNESGSFDFKGLVSPKLGVLYRASTALTIYGNISHGFSPLSLEETLLPNGQINTNLNPETGWNFEVGTRGYAAKNRLQYTVAVYRLAIKNLLVARRTSQDEFIGVNAGKTHNDGLEAEINYTFTNSKDLQLSAFGSYALHLYKFKDFIDDNSDFSGNDLTGVPQDVLNLGLDFSSKVGMYGNINFQHVGKMPITDSNSLFSESYSVSNIKIGYQNTLAPKLRLNAFLGVNNIFNTAYASQILINATGFGNSAPRYFYPGNPLNYYSGLALNYSF